MFDKFLLIGGIVLAIILVFIIIRTHINLIKAKKQINKMEDEQQNIINKLNKLIEMEEKNHLSKKI